MLTLAKSSSNIPSKLNFSVFALILSFIVTINLSPSTLTYSFVVSAAPVLSSSSAAGISVVGFGVTVSTGFTVSAGFSATVSTGFSATVSAGFSATVSVGFAVLASVVGFAAPSSSAAGVSVVGFGVTVSAEFTVSAGSSATVSAGFSATVSAGFVVLASVVGFAAPSSSAASVSAVGFGATASTGFAVLASVVGFAAPSSSAAGVSVAGFGVDGDGVTGFSISVRFCCMF